MRVFGQPRGTGTPTDQPYDTASAEIPENAFGLPAKSWANDKNVVLKVKSGKLDYALYNIDGKDIVVSETRAPDSNSPLQDFLKGMKKQGVGYAIYHIPGQIIPVFFNLTDADMNDEQLQEIMKIFTIFNLSLGLGGADMEKIFSPETLEHFFTRVGYVQQKPQ